MSTRKIRKSDKKTTKRYFPYTRRKYSCDHRNGAPHSRPDETSNHVVRVGGWREILTLTDRTAHTLVTSPENAATVLSSYTFATVRGCWWQSADTSERRGRGPRRRSIM